jgi:hypothetical protein
MRVGLLQWLKIERHEKIIDNGNDHEAEIVSVGLQKAFLEERLDPCGWASITLYGVIFMTTLSILQTPQK